MKYTSAVAAAALLGSASAGVHKMKLKKVPLSEQFVSGESFIQVSLFHC
jgi:hypothetical protein